MPKRIPGIMEKYEFSEEEQLDAMTFRASQLMYLQTELAIVMQEKLQLSGEDIESGERYVRAQEYHRGRMDMLNALIAKHDDMIASHAASTAAATRIAFTS